MRRERSHSARATPALALCARPPVRTSPNPRTYFAPGDSNPRRGPTRSVQRRKTPGRRPLRCGRSHILPPRSDRLVYAGAVGPGLWQPRHRHGPPRAATARGGPCRPEAQAGGCAAARCPAIRPRRPRPRVPGPPRPWRRLHPARATVATPRQRAQRRRQRSRRRAPPLRRLCVPPRQVSCGQGKARADLLEGMNASFAFSCLRGWGSDHKSAKSNAKR